MSNTCLKENPTILEIMAERDKLKQENEQLRIDNQILHNKLNEKKINNELVKLEYFYKNSKKQNEENDYDEQYKGYADGLEKWGYTYEADIESITN